MCGVRCVCFSVLIISFVYIIDIMFDMFSMFLVMRYSGYGNVSVYVVLV